MSNSSHSPSPEPETKKRKRSSVAVEELEVDINAPEPPSKKAARRLKKGKPTTSTPAEATATDETKSTGAKPDDSATAKHSAYGIWIGNLAFTADKASLRTFFSTHGSITEDEITRLHMPTPMAAPADKGRTLNKPANKGFAYIDFSTADALSRALALSETLMSGRKVLIKDAKSFAGRPDKTTSTSTSDGNTSKGPVSARDANAKPPSKRLFVGNLSFDVTKEDLENHFSQAGEIEDVHMATFEDSGKCKGFAWVRFKELESAEAAARGFIFKVDEDDQDQDFPESSDSSDNEVNGEVKDEDEDEEEHSDDSAKEAKKSNNKQAKKVKKVKKQKKRKWFINRLFGRPLRCEFAEDASVRYKKRFGKPAGIPNGGGEGRSFRRDAGDGGDGVEGSDAITEVSGQQGKRARATGTKEERQEQRRRKHVDARTIRPGAALANAPRASGAIVAGTGKKTTFDD